MIRWLTFAVPVALVVGVVLMLNRGLAPPEQEPTPVGSEQPRYSVKGANWVRLDTTGQPELRARAAQLDYYADKSVVMSDLTLDRLGGESSPWTMTAPHGRVPAGERSVLLHGDVIANGSQADEPLRFTTDSLWVDLLRRELRSESAIELVSEYRRASATGLQADFDGNRVRLLNNVQVEYVPEG